MSDKTTTTSTGTTGEDSAVSTPVAVPKRGGHGKGPSRDDRPRDREQQSAGGSSSGGPASSFISGVLRVGNRYRTSSASCTSTSKSSVDCDSDEQATGELGRSLDSSMTPSGITPAQNQIPSPSEMDGKKKEKKEKKARNTLLSLFTTSHKQKNSEIHKLFSSLPDTERLICDYSCALQRDILIHGRLYITQNWLCFYANIFSWETLLTIPFQSVQAITKEKTAFVIPNAIQIDTGNEKYGFSTLLNRDAAYHILFKVWQNSLLEQPLPPIELVKAARMVHGESLDLETEEELWGTEAMKKSPSLIKHQKQTSLPTHLEFGVVPAPPTVYPSSPHRPRITRHPPVILEGGGGGGGGGEGEGGEGGISVGGVGEGAGSEGARREKGGGEGGEEEVEKMRMRVGVGERLVGRGGAEGGGGGGGGREGRKRSGSGSLVSVNGIVPKASADNNTTTNNTDTSGGSRKGSYVEEVAPDTAEDQHPNSTKSSDNTLTGGEAGGKSSLAYGEGVSLGGDSVDSFETVTFLEEPGEIPCGCSEHVGRMIVNEVYNTDVETMFQLIFTDSNFMRDFLKARKTINLVVGDWQSQPSGTKIREMQYTVALNYSFGPKFAPSVETQVYSNQGQPGLKHIVDTEVVNANVPYSDTFFVSCRYCLTRVAHDQMRLRIMANINFKKNCWGVVKNLIERNAGDGLRSHCNHLDQFIKEYLVTLPAKKRKTLKKSSSRNRTRHKRPSASVSASFTPPNSPAMHPPHPRLDSASSRISLHSFDMEGMLDDASNRQTPKPTSQQPFPKINLLLTTLLALLILFNIALYYNLMVFQTYQPSPPSPPPPPPPSSSSSSSTSSQKAHVSQSIHDWPDSQQDWIDLMTQQLEVHEQQLSDWKGTMKELMLGLQQLEGVVTGLRAKLSSQLTEEQQTLQQKQQRQYCTSSSSSPGSPPPSPPPSSSPSSSSSSPRVPPDPPNPPGPDSVPTPPSFGPAPYRNHREARQEEL